MEAIFFLSVNLVVCYLIAKAGEKRKIGFGWSFFFSIFLTPLIGGIITMLSPKVLDNEN